MTVDRAFDRVVEVAKNASAVGLKNVSINENYFQGHFPGEPVMQGVTIVEAMARYAVKRQAESVAAIARQAAAEGAGREL